MDRSSGLSLSSPATNEQFADLRPPGARSVPPRGPLPPARVDQDVLAGEVVVQALGGRSLSDCFLCFCRIQEHVVSGLILSDGTRLG